MDWRQLRISERMLLHVLGIVALVVSTTEGGKDFEEEKYGVIYANDCEVCKLVTRELHERLAASGSSGVIETGYNIDGKKKKTKYNKSELRLVETLEDVCKGMLDYRVHKERKDSTRFAKKMSQTFQTLHNLVNKGVKVDLGMPYELWDEPSAEVSQLKIQCETFIEDYEEQITDWYFGEQAEGLKQAVCQNVLQQTRCLSEPNGEDVISDPDSEEAENSKKGDAGRSSRTEL